jgi:hypothetical protein
MGEVELCVLVEAAGDGDDGERGASIAGSQRVCASRPRVDHGDHAVDRGDALESGTDRVGGCWVVDVDVVGDDGDLAAGFGEFVEAFGDSAGFCAGSGAELGREDREG